MAKKKSPRSCRESKIEPRSSTPSPTYYTYWGTRTLSFIAAKYVCFCRFYI